MLRGAAWHSAQQCMSVREQAAREAHMGSAMPACEAYARERDGEVVMRKR